MTGETPEVRSDKRKEKKEKAKKREEREGREEREDRSWRIMEHHGLSWNILELRIEN